MRQLMDLGRNRRSVSSFLSAENLYCNASISTGVSRSNSLLHLPIAVILQWERLLFDFCSCRKKRANKTQLHEWRSRSEETISGQLECSNTLTTREENNIFFFSKRFKDNTMKKCKTWQKNITHSYSRRGTFPCDAGVGCMFHHMKIAVPSCDST